MSKRFTGTSQGYAFNPTVAKPLDIRTVVQYYSDLSAMDNEVPSYTYPGMIVAVVNDPTSDRNGVYYRKDNGDWEKIGSGSTSGDRFTFTVDHPFIKDEDSYTPAVEDIQSSEEMTLTNVYGEGHSAVAEVIAVKEENDTNRFHLMINPSLVYVLDGGTGMSTFINVEDETRTTANMNS